jgi:tetratricopeptide (TPR) repeat protein
VLVSARHHAAAQDAGVPAPQSHDPTAESAKLTALGTRAWERGDYDVALEYFRLAHRVYPSPNFHYNMGLALSGLDRDIEAIEAFETFLRLATDAPASTRTYSESRIVELDKRIGRIMVTTNVPGATAKIDGNAVPLGHSIRVAPGDHSVAVSRNGYQPRTVTVTITRGEDPHPRLHLGGRESRHRAAAPSSSTRRPAAREEHPEELVVLGRRRRRGGRRDHSDAPVRR